MFFLSVHVIINKIRLLLKGFITRMNAANYLSSLFTGFGVPISCFV